MFGIDLIIIMAIMAAVLAVASIATTLLMPKPSIEDAEPNGLGDYGFPTNLESRYIPVVWGAARVDGPNVIWYGDFSTNALDTAGADVAFQYSLGLDLALCWGEVETITAVQLDDEFFLKAGEVRAFVGGTMPTAGFVKTASGHRRISVKDLGLTGGAKKGGGIRGDISFYYGTADQPQSTYIFDVEDREGETYTLANGTQVKRSALLPSYKNVARMVWEGGMLTERAAVPAFKFHIQRYPRTLTSSYVKVRDDGTTADANPIHVIYEILTDVNWGLAVDPQLINRQSFIDAAKQCFDEGNGYSRTMDAPKQSMGVINNINDQVNGMLFQNENGLYEYKLSRKTYRESDNVILDYEGGIKADTTLTDSTGTAGIAYTGAAGAVAKIVSELHWNEFEVGDLILISNVTEGSGPRPCIVTELSSVASGLYYVFFASYTGEALDSDGTFMSGSAFVTVMVQRFSLVPKLTTSSIIKMKTADRQSWDQTFNTIHIKYLDRTQEFKETVANAVDSGNMAIRKGKRSIKKVDMQGIRHPETAALVAQRALKSYSYPLTTVALDVSRKFSYLRPGDIVEVDHPDFGLKDFYMRVIEVGLPQDSSGNVSVKGVRDVFDEPTSSIQVGGAQSLERIVPVAAVFPTSIELTGLPEWYHLKMGLDTSDVTTWHILAAPNATTISAQAYQLRTGVYEEVSTQAVMPASGKVIGHTSDIWTDRGLTPRYARETSLTDLKRSGPYGYGPGPWTNPVRHHTNSSSKMNQGFSNDSISLAKGSYDHDGNVESGGWITRIADILVTDLSIGYDQLTISGITEEQIKNHGFGLVLIRPAWANGDTRFDEICAYTEAKTLTLYTGYDEVTRTSSYLRNPVTSTTEYFVMGLKEPNKRTLEAHKCLALKGVYRGLLDTGIQVLNTDSEILFLGEGDPLYDSIAQVAGAATTAQTYRHAAFSVGSEIRPEDTSDLTVSADELQRRRRPLPPTKMRVNGRDPNYLWGFNRYDGGRWENYDVEDVGTSDLDLDWSTHDHSVSPELIKLYSEFDAVETTETLYASISLIDDDRTPDTTHRQRHLLARLKEGWMPTSPALHGGNEYTEGVNRTTLGFAAEFVWDGTDGNGAPNANAGVSIDLTAEFAAMASGSRPELTSGQEYFVEVAVQTKCNNSGLLSRGAQRFGIRFTATATVTNP
jgi:hypothetical protein